MSREELEALMRRIEGLAPEERAQLMQHLAHRSAQGTTASTQTTRAWRDICGAAQAPLVGEDAQAWVSRTRQEADETRLFQRPEATDVMP